MAKKPDKRKPDDPEQSQRFEETARDVEAVEDLGPFERLLARLSPKKSDDDPKTSERP